MILAIEPGNEKTAYAILDENLKPIEFNILENQKALETFKNINVDYAVIEMVASYGMAVGKEVFNTCFWIGRFYQVLKNPDLLFRKEVKINLCNSMKAKDTNIRQALIDRFGDVGTIKNKGWFYGVKKDIWAAIAVGVTYADKRNGSQDK